MNNSPIEHDEQVAFIRWCDWKKIDIFAIPNGSNKSRTAQRKFKAEGLRAGIPDLMIPIARNGYNGLFLEMKRKSGSSTSKEQLAWIEKLNTNGYYAVICKGADKAIEETERYLKECKT